MRSMEKSFRNIYKIFFKTGTLMLGGGYVILPILRCELVEHTGWITDDELCEYYALSQSLPGVIAANISIFTGYKLLGIRGAAASLAGIITPAFLSIILIAGILDSIVNTVFIKYIFYGVGIGVVLLLYTAVKEMWSKSIFDKFTVAIFLYALIFSVSGCSPVFIVITSIVCGIVYKQIAAKNEEKGK